MNRPKYINRSILQGVVATDPSIKNLTPATKVTSFQLVVVESWVNGQGEYRDRKNRITVDVVGRDAERIASSAKRGMWASIEGYYRSEIFKGQEVMKIRTLDIEVWSVE